MTGQEGFTPRARGTHLLSSCWGQAAHLLEGAGHPAAPQGKTSQPSPTPWLFPKTRAFWGSAGGLRPETAAALPRSGSESLGKVRALTYSWGREVCGSCIRRSLASQRQSAPHSPSSQTPPPASCPLGTLPHQPLLPCFFLGSGPLLPAAGEALTRPSFSPENSPSSNPSPPKALLCFTWRQTAGQSPSLTKDPRTQQSRSFQVKVRHVTAIGM